MVALACADTACNRCVLPAPVRAAEPTRAGDCALGHPPQMLDRLRVARGQKAREHRAIGKSDTKRKLLHDERCQDDGCAGGDQARRVNVAT